ncbi:hypothetical protein HMPREF9396_0014 [Streptococcus sanguinis SK1059]|nr:hypothetical protein HMPREF9396_0014 [Streptococcus sanguinis SK1059]EGQ22203.1 hypothetical protein HMPREF8573_0014 [Streptococcus sanguinis ATCC 29667]EGQ24765.1 hypothetical protein HMPREF9387_0592 [Streptococcus sanguinis SK340]
MNMKIQKKKEAFLRNRKIKKLFRDIKILTEFRDMCLNLIDWWLK